MQSTWRRRLGFWFRCWLWIAISGCGLQTAQAASSVMIWPVDPVIEDGQRAAAMWLENRGANNVSLQIRVFRWSQSGTTENFENQEHVLASPPLATIPPGQRQLVRLMNTGPVAPGEEQSFRVLVDELPEVDPPNDGTPGSSPSATIGVKLQIRYSVPLFINGKGLVTKVAQGNPTQTGQVNLRWRTVREGDSHYLVIRNSGNMHARLTNVQWSGAPQPQVINAGLLGYVLAGSEMRWPLAGPPPPGLKPEARINGAQTPLQLTPQ
jgi:fimbrial chaperone protein